MTQDALSLLQPFMDLIEDDFLREKVEDTARVYFTSPNFTVNLIPAIIIGLLLLIGLLKLLGLPILASFGLDGIGGSGDGGYGAPSSGYGQAYARGDCFDSTVADLQEQINQLVASNEALTNQVYYGSGVATNSVGSSVSSNLLSSS